jgi:hypothetical protein
MSPEDETHKPAILMCTYSGSCPRMEKIAIHRTFGPPIRVRNLRLYWRRPVGIGVAASLVVS